MQQVRGLILVFVIFIINASPLYFKNRKCLRVLQIANLTWVIPTEGQGGRLVYLKPRPLCGVPSFSVRHIAWVWGAQFECEAPKLECEAPKHECEMPLDLGMRQRVGAFLCTLIPEQSTFVSGEKCQTAKHGEENTKLQKLLKRKTSFLVLPEEGKSLESGAWNNQIELTVGECKPLKLCTLQQSSSTCFKPSPSPRSTPRGIRLCGSSHKPILLSVILKSQF